MSTELNDEDLEYIYINRYIKYSIKDKRFIGTDFLLSRANRFNYYTNKIIFNLYTEIINLINKEIEGKELVLIKNTNSEDFIDYTFTLDGKKYIELSNYSYNSGNYIKTFNSQYIYYKPIKEFKYLFHKIYVMYIKNTFLTKKSNKFINDIEKLNKRFGDINIFFIKNLDFYNNFFIEEEKSSFQNFKQYFKSLHKYKITKHK